MYCTNIFFLHVHMYRSLQEASTSKSLEVIYPLTNLMYTFVYLGVSPSAPPPKEKGKGNTLIILSKETNNIRGLKIAIILQQSIGVSF